MRVWIPSRQSTKIPVRGLKPFSIMMQKNFPNLESEYQNPRKGTETNQ